MSSIDTERREARPEGRFDEAFAEALRRAQADYLEMPGLRLTAAQAARLWSFDDGLCSAVLCQLVEARFLVRTRNAMFARA